MSLNPMHIVASNFNISDLPQNASQEQITNYKLIRLSSLYTNPEAFGSTFARESLFTPETWFDRVNGQARRIIFAIPAHIQHEILPSGCNLPNTFWMGTVCVLWPEMIKAIPPVDPYPLELARREEKGDVDVYMIVGMWVHPDSRRLGVGKALIHYAIQNVLAAESAGGEKQKVITLKVHEGNKAATALYQGVGFVSMGPVDGSGGKWMVYGL
ncbi:hypothetical protein CVT24_003355 [Panaeolus cyanescens]|uniref:N-acetyltransferase domain-containing protein n=1 Tax=Panaeolus cyanescens TaxID=181874 RepID=A0A409Y6X0_9AGAR|nr:hypothetical protein CVT24_003355 [Panaeolus cyanescens]